MKIVVKLITASVLAMSAIVPAFAAEPEADVLNERNTYLFTPDARPIVQHQNNVDVRKHQGVDAMASSPARTSAPLPTSESVIAY